MERVGDLISLSPEGLGQACTDFDQPAYRGRQIADWIYRKRAQSIQEMTDLPQGFRDRLSERFRLFAGEVISHQVASDRTEKLLIDLPDGETVECVLMRETSRRTVCISTQVGCAMGCVFCASGLLGVKRNLTTAEILEQVLRADRLLDPQERVPRLTNIVVMGIGEPLANLGHLLPALEAITAPDRLGLSPRRITVSTVGLPEKIREFAGVGKPFNLAISLHAPNDELRTEIVPVNRNIGIDAILSAADDFFSETGRRVTYEYILLAGKNDRPHHARELGERLSSRKAHVNLIPMNAVEELPFAAPDVPATEEFAKILDHAGVAVTIRKRKGADIDAACGQLRLNRETREARR